MTANGYLHLKRAKLDALARKRAALAERNRAAAQARTFAWMADPVAWVADCVRFPAVPASYVQKQGLAPYQAEALRTVADDGRLLVFGPHGLGKSTTMSLALWWFATTRELAGIDWKAITTASSWKQLKDFLWPEIHKWAKCVDWELLGLKEPEEGKDLLDLAFRGEWGAASAAASSDPAKMEGAHATHLMYFIDEGKAVPAPTWDAIEGAFSTAGAGVLRPAGAAAQGGAAEQPESQPEPRPIRDIFALAASTPGPASGRFYSIASKKPGFEDWTVKHVTKAQVIEAGRMNEKWAAQRAEQWGPHSSVYRMRVEGEFFLDDPEALIPLAWAEAAVARWDAWRLEGRPTHDPERGFAGPRYAGVDVAGGGADRSVMAKRWGPHILRLEYPRGAASGDLMRTTDWVVKEAGKLYRPVVDTLGIGAGVTDRLKELRAEAALPGPLAFVGARSSKLRNATGEYGFANERSAAWWMVREALDPQYGREAMLPPDPMLTADLTAPTWQIVPGSPPKIKVEVKEKVKEKLGRSPDFGDAVAMAYWAGAARTEVRVAQVKERAGGTGASNAGPLARGSAAPRTARLGASDAGPLARQAARTAGRTKGGLLWPRQRPEGPMSAPCSSLSSWPPSPWRAPRGWPWSTRSPPRPGTRF